MYMHYSINKIYNFKRVFVFDVKCTGTVFSVEMRE